MFNTLDEKVRRNQSRVFILAERVMRSLGVNGVTALLLACFLLAIMLLE